MEKERRYKRTCAVFIAVVLGVVTLSCAGFNAIQTTAAEEAEVSGSFTVILFGANISNDPRTLGVLDLEGDDYTFIPSARKDDYLTRKGVTAKEALAEARYFTGRYSYFLSHQLKKIIDPEGNVIGYEIRPLFHTRKFGAADILDVNYRLSGKEVMVSVNIKKSIEDRIFTRGSYQ
ncbi:MAG: hypothetical protein JSU90_12110 [Nitrospiraceae bacterium]|nr:MAG: hypothetical protein JSU90_12110 [Nitrospiraceae bacterium]